MIITPISEALKTAPGTILAGVRGNIKAIGEFASGEQDVPGGGKRPWSLQTLILEQDGAEISVEVAHKPVISNSALGRGLHLLSHEREGGKALVGIKVVCEEGHTFLRVTAKGELVFMDTAAKMEPKPKPAEPISTGSGQGAGPAPASIEPVTAASPTSRTTAAIAPGLISDMQILAKVDLYDRCMKAVLAGVGGGIADNSGFLMAPEGVHAATRTVFEAVLKETLSRPQS